MQVKKEMEILLLQQLVKVNQKNIVKLVKIKKIKIEPKKKGMKGMTKAMKMFAIPNL